MAQLYADAKIDEYLRKRLMPVEGVIPQIRGIEMYGNSVPVGTVGGGTSLSTSISSNVTTSTLAFSEL